MSYVAANMEPEQEQWPEIYFGSHSPYPYAPYHFVHNAIQEKATDLSRFRNQDHHWKQENDGISPRHDVYGVPFSSSPPICANNWYNHGHVLNCSPSTGSHNYDSNLLHHLRSGIIITTHIHPIFVGD